MRQEQEVTKRTRELLATLKKKFIEERSSRAHFNCVYNRRCVQRNADFRYCNLKTDVDESADCTGAKIKRLFVCDCDEWSQRCAEFLTENTQQRIENEFYEIVKSPSRCGHTFPHLAALLWTLNDSKNEPTVKEQKSWFEKLRELFS